MKINKDSKKNKPKTQEKFQSPLNAEKNLQESFIGLEIAGLSPLRPFYDTLSFPTQLRNTSLQMEIITTPANLVSRKSYLEQVDETYKQISDVIQWNTQSMNESDQEQYDSEEISGSLEREVSEIQEEPSSHAQPHLEAEESKKIPLLYEQESKQEPKEKIRRAINQTPKSMNKPQNGKKVFCNCKKTKCLKLYCDCFRDGQTCGEGCNCQGCHNLESYEELRNNSMFIFFCFIFRLEYIKIKMIYENQTNVELNGKKSRCIQTQDLGKTTLQGMSLQKVTLPKKILLMFSSRPEMWRTLQMR